MLVDQDRFSDVGPQELEAGGPFKSCSIYVDGDMGVCFLPPEVHNELFGLAGIQKQVIVSNTQLGALLLPCSQTRRCH